jgi:hypothetical protein
MVAATRTAVVGGDGRNPERWRELGEVEVYRSPRDGGNGELRRLEHALRSGSFQRVVILASFNGHAATVRVRHICAAKGVEVLIVRGSGPRAVADVCRGGSKGGGDCTSGGVTGAGGRPSPCGNPGMPSGGGRGNNAPRGGKK